MAQSPLLAEKPNPLVLATGSPCLVSLQADMSGVAGAEGHWPAHHRPGEYIVACWPRDPTLLAGQQVSVAAVGRGAAASPQLANHFDQ